MLGRRLELQGFTVDEAENGQQAIEKLKAAAYDLVLLDVLMPGINGYETLKLIKGDLRTRHIPVIMISAIDEVDNAVKCIEIGAEDFVPKPFNPVLLRARISSSLAKKRAHDQDQHLMTALRIEREKYERLLINILPKTVVERVRTGEANIANDFDAVSVIVVYPDLADSGSDSMPTVEFVRLINDLYSGFDWLADHYGLERIRSENDHYMAVAGAPDAAPDHAERAAKMALELTKVIGRFNQSGNVRVGFRAFINSGPCSGGIIGRKQFMYYIWGDTVDTAKRLKSIGGTQTIVVGETTAALLLGSCDMEPIAAPDGSPAAYHLKGLKTGETA